MGEVLSFPAKFKDGKQWEPWVTEKTIANHYKVSISTIWRWRKKGLPSTLIEGSRRYKISACESWLNHDKA